MAIDGTTSAFTLEPSGGACSYTDWAANPAWRSAGGRYFNNGQGPDEIIDAELVNYIENTCWKIERQIVSGCARLWHGGSHAPGAGDPLPPAAIGYQGIQIMTHQCAVDKDTDTWTSDVSIAAAAMCLGLVSVAGPTYVSSGRVFKANNASSATGAICLYRAVQTTSPVTSFTLVVASDPVVITNTPVTDGLYEFALTATTLVMPGEYLLGVHVQDGPLLVNTATDSIMNAANERYQGIYTPSPAAASPPTTLTLAERTGLPTNSRLPCFSLY